MTPTPTKEQIELAEALQKRGLCQRAKLWVWKVENPQWIMDIDKCEKIEYRAASITLDRSGQLGDGVKVEKIGPIPTASEVWPELVVAAYAILRKKRKCGTPEHFALHAALPFLYKGDDLDTAMAKALIELEGEAG